MKKEQRIIHDGELTKAEKERLTKEYFEKEKQSAKQGRLIAIYSNIALYFNLVVTTVFYFFYLTDLLISVFFFTDLQTPDDFSPTYPEMIFITFLVILIIAAINLTMAISVSVCSSSKKNLRAVSGTAFCIAAAIDLIVTVMQLFSQFTYENTAAFIAMLANILCLILSAIGIYLNLFTDKVTKYTEFTE